MIICLNSGCSLRAAKTILQLINRVDNAASVDSEVLADVSLRGFRQLLGRDGGENSWSMGRKRKGRANTVASTRLFHPHPSSTLVSLHCSLVILGAVGFMSR
ncbi:hypothetical protein BaRGS_00012427 [Batillaria attramentaria]|uniref:Uncharacterized protein n=1 Tax=Batillaria attramentaria TaxID=370345 RepID=A0ABD0L9T6_9CAEN